MYGGFASPKMDMNRRNVSSAIQERNCTCSLKSLTPFACTDTEKLPALWRACLFPHAQMPENYLRFGESANFRWYKCRRSTCIAAVLLFVACIDAGCHAATRCRGRIPRSKATSLWHPKTRYRGQKPLSFLPSCPISWLLSRILDDVQLLLPNIEP